MPKVMFVAKPYQVQITIDGEWGITPIWKDFDAGQEVQIATQNQLNGLNFHHWELNGTMVSVENISKVQITDLEEVEVMAVFK
jgi:hypothetical protein